MIKLLTIIGARPQFIKAAAISRAIGNKFNNEIEEVIVHTGQHYDESMSKVFFEELKIPKEKYNLQIGSGSHAQQTAKMLMEIESVVLAEKPNAVLLYGDTNSTLAACLVAIKLHLPIIHVEAGVRGYNKYFPEEVNRIVTDHLSTLLFVPSVAGMESLEREGFPSVKETKDIGLNNPGVFQCGDIMYDNTLFFREQVLKTQSTIFEKYDIPNENFILATMHRPSNVDQHETLKDIISAFKDIVEKHSKTIVLPLHPRTKSKIETDATLKEMISDSRIKIISPVSFLEMIVLEENCDLVMTDSGGVQKEAYFLEKPCVIMLEETPWIELLESGNAVLSGSDYEKITGGVDKLLQEKDNLVYPKMYGDGKASEFICQKIIDVLKK